MPKGSLSFEFSLLSNQALNGPNSFYPDRFVLHAASTLDFTQWRILTTTGDDDDRLVLGRSVLGFHEVKKPGESRGV